MKEIVKIRFDASAELIKVQLEQQGHRYANKLDCWHFQKDNEAITRLFNRGLITESTAKRCRKILFTNIQKSLISKP